MPNYRIWCPLHDEGEDSPIETTREIEAESFQRAAIRWAETEFWQEPFTSRVYMVRNLKTNELREICVDVESVPHFDAYDPAIRARRKAGG